MISWLTQVHCKCCFHFLLFMLVFMFFFTSKIGYNPKEYRVRDRLRNQVLVPLRKVLELFEVYIRAKLVKENKVVPFIKGTKTAPLCGFSQRVVGILESQGVNYESVDVLDEEYNYDLRETLKSYSNWPTFPQVFVDGELIGGCDILTAMYEKGELANIQK